MPKKIKVKKIKVTAKNAKKMDIAIEHFQSGNLKQADTVCRQIIQGEPEHADALYMLGLIAGRSGQYDESIFYISKAIRINPYAHSYYNDLGVSLRFKGNFNKAKESFEKAIELKPDFAEAYDNLGAVLQYKGIYDEAIDNHKKALSLKPDYTVAYNNMGNALREKGLVDEAIESFKKALMLKPDYAEACSNLGRALREKGMFEEAIECYKKALTITPSDAGIYSNLGTALADKGMIDEAIDNYRKALTLRPDYIGVYNDLGISLYKKGMIDEAIEEFRKALKLKPDFAEAHYNLGVALKEKNKLDEAIEELRNALTIKPDYADAYNNLGTALKEKGKLDEAINNYRKALKLKLDNPLVYYNLGSALSDKGLVGEALNHYRMALTIKPDYDDAHWNMSLELLKRSNFEQGWRKFEWRLLEKDYIPLYSPQPIWDGRPLNGRAILIQAEQGVGDEIMFASCLPDVISQDCHCVLECDRRLMPLFSRSFPEVRLIPRLNANYPDQNHLPQADVKLAIGSLPLFFRPDFDSFPQQKSYLVPDKQEVEKWSIRFKELGEGLKVGISWRGGKEPGVKLSRSISLEQWSQVLSVSGVHFVNLQYGECAKEIEEAEAKYGMKIHDWDDADPMKDLDNFAAKIAALDLVISVDNSTVHMAGALGVPVWTLLPFACDWRWMQDVEDTPWYKSVKLCRQSTLGDWESVLERVEHDLGEYVTTGVIPGIEHGNSYENRGEGRVKSISEEAANHFPLERGDETYKCAVITPVGPGHEGLYEECLESINKSYDKGKGRFSEIIYIRVDDTEGRLGRSRARNSGIKEAAEQGADWLFFLDADDLMAPSAFEYASNYLDKYDAVWGSIWSIEEGQQARERDGQLSFLWSIEDVLSFDPFVSLQMGHFVKTSVALSALFNESLDTGEDFDYYLRVWEKHKCIKMPLPFFYNRRGLHSQGPRAATGGQWRQVVECIIEEYRIRIFSDAE